VVFTNHIPHDTGRFLVGPVPVVVQLVHGEQHAPVHRLEAIARIRQGPAHDHAHGVIEITAAHLLFKADGQGFFGELGHGRAGKQQRRAILGASACSGGATEQHHCAFVLRAGQTKDGHLSVTYGTIDFNVFGGGHQRRPNFAARLRLFRPRGEP
jgi:hypothetical protein